MSIYDDFEAIRREQKDWRDQAKQEFIPGIDPAELKPGALVTLSPNLRIGCRSFCTDIARVVAVNACHAQIQLLTGFWKDRGPQTVVLAEHHFYAADGWTVPGDDQ